METKKLTRRELTVAGVVMTFCVAAIVMLAIGA